MNLILGIVILLEHFRGMAFEGAQCPEGFADSSDGYKCFVGMPLDMDFNSAVSFCEDVYNATLPLVTSAQEQHNLIEYFHAYNYFWIGVKGRLSLTSSGQVQVNHTIWSDGNQYNFTQWDTTQFKGQPGADYYCAEAELDLNTGEVFWVPRDCHLSSNSLVCEMPKQWFDSKWPLNGVSVHHNDYFDNDFFTTDQTSPTAAATTASVQASHLSTSDAPGNHYRYQLTTDSPELKSENITIMNQCTARLNKKI